MTIFSASKYCTSFRIRT